MKLGVFIASYRPWMIPNIQDNLNRQVRQPDLVVFMTTYEMPKLANLPAVYLGQAPDSSGRLGAVMNQGIEEIVKQFTDGLACNMDDDDEYGENYLQHLEDTYTAHPDAWLLGAATFDTCYRDAADRITGRVIHDQLTIYPDGRCQGVAGATITLALSKWVEYPEWRFPPTHFYDSRLTVLTHDMGGTVYTIPPGDYTMWRHLNPRHSHSWVDPRDRKVE